MMNYLILDQHDISGSYPHLTPGTVMMRIISPALLLLLLLGIRPALAQPFAEVHPTGLQGVRDGFHAWGDYNNDGLPDYFLSGAGTGGRYQALLYENRGNGSFRVAAGNSFPGLVEGDAAWGDYNNDGWADLVVTGSVDGFPSGGQTLLYRNTGRRTLEPVSTVLPALHKSHVNFVDYDNDGDHDIFLTGLTRPAFYEETVIKLYDNQQGVFTDSGIAFGILPPDVSGTGGNKAVWADLDNDGDLDLVLNQNNVEGGNITIYQNNGDRTFTLMPFVKNPGSRMDLACTDYNGDGLADLLLNGLFTMYGGAPPPNNGEFIVDGNAGGLTFARGGFYDTGGGKNGSLAVGDYDLDGWTDALVNGLNLGIPRTFIQRNLGGEGLFARETGLGLVGTQGAGACWVDVDQDRDLDILVAGAATTGAVARLYRNNTPRVNHPPSPPANLRVEVSGTTALLRWDPASDAETPTQLLTYNVRIGTRFFPHSLLSGVAPGANAENSPPAGNAGQNPFLVIKDLPNGCFEWEVRAVDNAYAASAPSALAGFSVQVAGNDLIPAFGSANYCHGELTAFAPANLWATDSLRWDFGDPDSGTDNQSTLAEAGHAFSAPGTYTVQLTTYTCGVARLASQPVTILPRPPVELGRDTMLCQGQSLRMAVQSEGSYRWSTGATGHEIQVTAPGRYWVRVTGPGGCTGSDTITVAFRPRWVDLGPDVITCQPGPVILDATSENAVYTWSTGAVSPSITVNTPGTYWVRVTGLDGCTGSDTITVAFRPRWVDLGPDVITCQPGPVILDATSENAVYTWSTGAVSPSITANTPGTYWVTVAGPDGCTASDTVRVELNGIAVVAAEAAPAVADGNQPVRFTASGGAGGDDWQWDFGDSTAAAGPQVEHTYATEGTYQVTLRVGNARGCSRQSTVPVQVLPHLFIPNVLTANHDGYNDAFQIEYNGKERFQLDITDRWGKRVFASDSVHRHWTGEGCSPGVYFYCLRVGSRRYNGWVHLLR